MPRSIALSKSAVASEHHEEILTILNCMIVNSIIVNLKLVVQSKKAKGRMHFIPDVDSMT